MWWYGRGNSGGSWPPAFPPSWNLDATNFFSLNWCQLRHQQIYQKGILLFRVSYKSLVYKLGSGLDSQHFNFLYLEPDPLDLTYLPTYLPSHLPTYLPTYLSTYLPTYLPTSYLPTYLPPHFTTHLPTHLPTYLPNYSTKYMLIAFKPT